MYWTTPQLDFRPESPSRRANWRFQLAELLTPGQLLPYLAHLADATVRAAAAASTGNTADQTITGALAFANGPTLDVAEQVRPTPREPLPFAPGRLYACVRFPGGACVQGVNRYGPAGDGGRRPDRAWRGKTHGRADQSGRNDQLEVAAVRPVDESCARPIYS